MTWPFPIDHTYILCDPKKEPERATYLIKWLRAHNMTNYTMGLTCYADDITADISAKVYNPWVDRRPVERERSFNSYNLKQGEISLVLNWASAAQKAIKAGHKIVMMLESDVLFHDDFLEKLTDAMKQLEGRQWDFLSLSAGANLRPQRAADDTTLRWFPSPGYYHTRTTDAMIFKVTMLEKINGTLIPFAEVLDWELNYQLSLHNSTSLWLDPPILRQGSGSIYPTTL